MRFRHNGQCLEGTPLAVNGLHISVQYSEPAENGLERRSVKLITAHDAEDANEFWRHYFALGGEMLFDESGNPVCGP